MEEKEIKEVTDQELDILLDEKRLSEHLKEAEQRQKRLSTEEYYALRVRAKHDLFFLAYGILGYTRLSERLHGHFCKAIQDTEGVRFRLFLMPRGHFKTTIKVIAHAIQQVLPWDKDYDDIEPEWPANLGTNARILIAHETDKGASRHLFSISTQILTNTTLMMLFPEIVPSPRRQVINKSELELPRTGIFSEPTFDTMGVGAKSQGRHYDHLMFDDIYGDKARDSEAEDATTKEWVDSIQGFYTRYNKSRADFDGTRYKYNDVYGHLIDRYGNVEDGGRLYVYRRSIEELNPETKKIEPIFSEEIDPRDIEVARKGSKKFWVQLTNDPVEGDEGFDSSNLNYFYWKGLSEIITFPGPNGKLESGPNLVQDQVTNIYHLDRCILLDPGIGKSGGFVVTGVDWRERIFTLEAVRLEEKPEITVDRIFTAVNKWHPRLVAVESDVFQAALKPWLESEMQNRGKYFEVFPVKTKKVSKDTRIAALGIYLANSLFWVNEKQEALIKEFETWGRTKDIHILDALAYGPEIWRKPLPPAEQKKYEDGQKDGQRDVQTGYSLIS